MLLLGSFPPLRGPITRLGRVRCIVVSAALLLVAAGCAVRGNGELAQGATGLEATLPGGDGRALRAYRSEYRSDVIRWVDSLAVACQQSWQRDDGSALASAYDQDAVLIPGDGSLVVGTDAVRAYFEGLMPGQGSFITWRDQMMASGEMAFTFGRYQASRRDGRTLHRGFHFTVASRRGRDWKIRAQGFFPQEGVVPVVPDAILAPYPPSMTVDLVRDRRGGGDPFGAGAAIAEWAVGTYWTTNSTVQSLQHSWNVRDVDGLMGLMAADATVRLPDGLPLDDEDEIRAALTQAVAGSEGLVLSILDHDASERLSYALGQYTLESGREAGFYVVVLRLENQGPSIRALLFSGGGPSSTQEGAAPVP